MGNARRGIASQRRGTMAEEFIPDIAVNLSTAALIWLFGVLVFLPMAVKIDPEGLPILISLITFCAFSLFLIRGLRGLGRVLDAASDVLAYEWTRRRETKKETDLTKGRMRLALKVGIVIIIYLLYSPLLLALHPSINGIAIILSILGIVWILLKKNEKSITR